MAALLSTASLSLSWGKLGPCPTAFADRHRHRTTLDHSIHTPPRSSSLRLLILILILIILTIRPHGEQCCPPHGAATSPETSASPPPPSAQFRALFPWLHRPVPLTDHMRWVCMPTTRPTTFHCTTLRPPVPLGCPARARLMFDPANVFSVRSSHSLVYRSRGGSLGLFRARASQSWRLLRFFSEHHPLWTRDIFSYLCRPKVLHAEQCRREGLIRVPK
ncbi:hypothetical protein BS50DRAFT_348991 [Corynespora cassiicola Philippines]|uniref:Uncharacterized protein n=1 Tax=Corynespora cassiicola Philippines TaxID=1448308 RepID=A0A2T2NQZ8_CORCC|nr:hypothetical protein BS50DRAFT_348991 [Corynespora cassiicola Philippines]